VLLCCWASVHSTHMQFKAPCRVCIVPAQHSHDPADKARQECMVVLLQDTHQ
jgi:hypothetical protein